MDRERARLLASARSGMFGAEVQRWANLTTGQGFKLRNLTEDGRTVTELFIYDSIGGWFGIAAQDVVRELMSIDTETINVRINSPGGDVFDGIAIMNALRSHPAKITVTVDSLCASIATAIAMAGETITMMPGSQMMIHNASGLAMGQASDMRKLADLLDFQTRNIATQYSRRAGGTVDDWLAAMDAETWLSDDEAVAHGLADAVGVVEQGGAASIPGGVQIDVLDDAWNLAGFKFAGRADAPDPVLPVEDKGPGRTEWNLVHDDGDTCEECTDIEAANPHYPKPKYNGYPLPHPNCDGRWEATRVVRAEAEEITEPVEPVDPIVLHFQTELAADNTVRQAMKEALV